MESRQVDPWFRHQRRQAGNEVEWASQNTIRSELLPILKHVNAILGHHQQTSRTDLRELQIALDRTQDFIDQIHISAKESIDWTRLIAIVHTLDHMQRLHERCEEEEDRANTAMQTDELKEYCQLMTESNFTIINSIEANCWEDAAHTADDTSERIHIQIESLRDAMMSRIASGEIDVPTGTSFLESIRWLRRVSKHIARNTKHYHQAVIATGDQP